MPTLLQLRAEGPWWDAETMSPTMQTLTRQLIAFYNAPAGSIGAKGDTAPGHMQGAHRSRNWIRNSSYCTNTTYTVSETPGNRTGGNSDWLGGMDITIPRDPLIAACQRLDVAVRAGRLEKITEWYGNKDGDLRVDGYDNIRNQVATSDDSHLWHLHITFDRGLAGEDHSDLYAILTGEEDMTPEQARTQWATYFYVEGLAKMQDPIVLPARTDIGYAGYKVPNALAQKLVEIDTAVDAIGTASGLDVAGLKAALRSVIEEETPDIAAAMLAAVTPELRDAVADLGEGGAEQVRADA